MQGSNIFPINIKKCITWNKQKRFLSKHEGQTFKNHLTIYRRKDGQRKENEEGNRKPKREIDK